MKERPILFNAPVVRSLLDDIKPRVDSIRMWTSRPQRPKPKFGDLGETKKHGKQVRIFRMATWNGRMIGYDCTGGRQNYDWVSYDEAVRLGYGHALPRVDAPTSPTPAQEGKP